MEDKQELLSQLYTLRAGLSVISQEKDKEQAINEDADSKIISALNDMGICIYKDECNHCYEPEECVKSRKKREQIKKAQEEYTKQQEYLKSKELEARNSDINEYHSKMSVHINSVLSGEFSDNFRKKSEMINSNDDNEMRNAKRAFIKWFILFFISFVIGLGGLYCFYIKLEFFNFISIWLFIFSFCGLVGFGIPMFINLYYFNFWRKSYKSEIKETKSYYEKIERKRKKFIPYYNTIEDERVEKLAPVARRSRAAYDMLRARFAEMLDERDWQYVDLIIYYFETRRALTLREALQLVDREVQTQAIINSVQFATQQICNTIRREMGALRRTIEDGFDRISAQLGLITELQFAQLEKSDLTNALLAKSAASSSQLASDAAYMRRYWTGY